MHIMQANTKLPHASSIYPLLYSIMRTEYSLFFVSPAPPKFKYRLLWKVSVHPSWVVCGASHKPFQEDD